jgi:hypothetical protein
VTNPNPQAVSKATPKGSWPFCPAHPDTPMFWHPAGWGWGCAVERSRDQSAPQPYVLVAGRGARVDRKGLVPPADGRATPPEVAWAEAKWAGQALGSRATRPARYGRQVTGKQKPKVRR